MPGVLLLRQGTNEPFLENKERFFYGDMVNIRKDWLYLFVETELGFPFVFQQSRMI
jgi:hypothetical protein